MNMSDEFEDISSRIPDMGAVLAQRIMSKKASESGNTPLPHGTYDPYQLLIQKQRGESIPAEIDKSTIQTWPDESIKALQDYCNKMGIIGFSSGKMNPIAALSMLKQQYGVDYTNVPLNERIPLGYEKLGTRGYGPNYPYTEAMRKKQILHG